MERMAWLPGGRRAVGAIVTTARAEQERVRSQEAGVRNQRISQFCPDSSRRSRRFEANLFGDLGPLCSQLYS